MSITKAKILSILPKPKNNNLVVEENQDVRDIINLIAYAHKKCTKDYDLFAANFWTGDIYTTCENLYNFCKSNIAYNIESKEAQMIKTPARILSDNSGDCKYYALFIAGVLDALNRQGIYIDWCYRFASYNIFDATPGHVFVVVFDGDQEIWVDPVIDEFDYKKAFISGIDKFINTSGSKQIAGIGASSTAVLSTTTAVLAVIPGAQPAAIVLGIVSTFANLFKGMPLPTNEMWLTAWYQYWVLGQSNVKSDHTANASYYPQAANWFTNLLGVPIYDQYTFAAIRGVDPSQWRNLNLSVDQRIANYRSAVNNTSKPNIANISSGQQANLIKVQQQVNAIPDVNIQLACYISDYLLMPYQGNTIPGSWQQVLNNQAGILQDLMNKGIFQETATAPGQATQSIIQTPETTAPVTTPGAITVFGLNLFEIAAIGLGIIFLTNNK